MFGITDMTTYVIGVIAVILLPGPNSIYVLTTAAQQGVRRGYAAACGVFVGDAVLMLLATLGAATVLKTAPQLFLILKTVGGVYLAYLGIKMLLGAREIWRKRGQIAAQTSSNLLQQNATLDDAGAMGDAVQHMDAVEHNTSPFVRALLVSLINPKAILFLVSFFVNFVRPDAVHPYVAFTILAEILQFFSFLYLSILIFSGAKLAAAFRARPLWMVGGTGAVGALFVGFGVKLATATLE